jgi:predicted acyltransferase
MSLSADALPKRLVSLDTFRGATIALMVLVNTPGDGRHVYGPLNHAEWNGWTITDTIFPSFLWIAGVAITLSFQSRLANGVGRATLLRQALRRTAILYLLGLLIYAYPEFSFSTQRILGVLQRIAICYGIVAAIYLYSGVRAQIGWIVGLLAGYWMIMFLAPVPGYGSGRLDVEGNFAHYVDRIVLGAHNYKGTGDWDPEGIVSTIPSIATALFGVMAGHIIGAKSKALVERIAALFTVGNLLIGAGLIANIWLPINKKLWTSSFALFMGGLDFVLLALSLWFIDYWGRQRFAKPFVILGLNSIAIYMASELVDEFFDATGVHHAVYQMFTAVASPVNASLLYAISYVGLMFAIAYGMYRKKWFVRA